MKVENQTNLRFFFLLLSISLLFAACGEASNSSAQPYKAKSVEECIAEKDCVWHALSHLERNTTATKNGKSFFIKWNKDVEIETLGDSGKLYQPELDAAILALRPNFPFSVHMAKKYNTLVIFSENLDQDVTVKYKEGFRQMMGDDRVLNGYLKVKNASAPINCAALSFLEKDTSLEGAKIVLVNTAGPDVSNCLATILFNSVGLNGKIENFPFSVMNVPEVKDQEPTKLDRFLLSFIYDPRFEKASSLEEAKTTFELVYPEHLAKYQQ